MGGFESQIRENGARNHPLSELAKALNWVKSSFRACVEHVFGCMTLSMGGKPVLPSLSLTHLKDTA